MSPLVLWLQLAGGVQLGVAIANVLLPRRLSLREQLPRLSPILAQILIVHWVYILIVLLIFGSMCLLFAPDLAGGSALGRFTSGCLAAFWLLRIPIQLFYYDPAFRRRHRAGDVAMVAACVFLGAVFSAAALGVAA